ncbi:hypothetical protein [Falsihalocynthiibacter arcticus]|uniref:Uncharacterized protein n=1 Tax=Falsihalocynthiibacter arcticus TaxID=1579316 RepID=A0A126UWM0_9RHOB|nr:hypothetical protein [Falsihalocynthiibacter arcticus]AML50458.1 hypothetical protein RC74_03505 [Falsihalocynthiibacter arcticus]
MASERLSTLRLHGAIAHAPEASERVRLAHEAAELAGVAAEVPRSFCDGNMEQGMATHVDVNLSSGRRQLLGIKNGDAREEVSIAVLLLRLATGRRRVGRRGSR